MSYALRDAARSQMKSRLEKIDASERANGPAGSAVSENYGSKPPSSSAKFKRGGAVKDHDSDDKAMRRPDRPGKKPKREDGGPVKYPNKVRGLTDAEVDENEKRRPPNMPDDNPPPPQRASGGRVKRADGGEVDMDYAKDVAANAVERGQRSQEQSNSNAGSMRPNPNATYDPRTGKVSGFKQGGRPHRAAGGPVKANKGKTNINIIISPQGGGDKQPMPMPVPVPAPPPGPPMAGPPPGGPPPQIPPQALAALAAQGGAGPGGPPPMRKRGGAVKMDAGAGGGEGRLEKIKKYGAKQK